MKFVRPIVIDDTTLASTNVAESETAWSAAATYAAGDQCRVGHVVYQSVQGSNLNHDPTTDNGTCWIKVGPTNAWAMFDGAVSSQTENANSIEVEIDAPAGSRVDSVAIMNVSGASARVRMTDATDGVVYDETFSLVSTYGIADWYSYFFEPIDRLSDLFVGALPPYPGATINVDILETGATVKCGALVIGLAREIGETLSGVRVGIRDYSRKEADDFGNYQIVERAFSKRANFTVLVPRGLTDQVQSLLARYRAVPIVYVGSAQFGSTLVFGFYRDFDLSIDYPTHSLCTIEIEGLA